MSSSINASTSAGGGIIQSADASGILALQTAGVTAVTIDASQNVGIGTSSPVSFGAGYVVQTINATTGPSLQMSVNGTRTGYIFTTATEHQTGTLTAIPYTFYTNANERMRIDSSGNLLVGTTAKPTTNFYGLYVKSSTSSSADWGFWADNSSANAALRIRNDGYVNSLSTYSLTGGTANLSIDSGGYITRATSSIRYKRDVETYDKGLSTVLAARPVYYKSSVADANGNVPETQFAGLIAEELDALGLNEFVEYNQEGQPDAVRYGNMVSLCIKAIQEQQALITTLTERLTALENK